MGGFTLKVKTKSGQHVVSDLSENETIGNLKAKISELTNIPANSLNVLNGFPPKPLDLSSNDSSISSSGIASGDTLIVEEKQGVDVSAVRNDSLQIEEDTLLAQRLAAEQDGTSVSTKGILLKQVVPSDNSCLFTSIGYVMSGKVDTHCGSYMRELIAQHVSNDKESYNEAFLGRPNSEYCEWIKKSSSWGGAIEVSILSSYYGVEFAVVDITNALINRFGEDRDFGMRAFLLFDGIHYDPLYLESFTDQAPKTMFDINDEDVMHQAEQLAQEAKSSRQFTDVDKFMLKCMECGVHLKGQAGAQQHATSTGHANFGEV